MTEFYRRGITRVFAVPTLTLTAPTAIQVNAGTEVTEAVADITGFTFQNSPIATPKLSTTFTTSIAGEDTAEEPQLTFYEDDDTNPLQATFAKGTITHLVFFYKGTAGATPAAADEVEIWPVQSTGPSREYSMDNTAAKWMARFTPTDPPVFDDALV